MCRKCVYVAIETCHQDSLLHHSTSPELTASVPGHTQVRGTPAATIARWVHPLTDLASKRLRISGCFLQTEPKQKRTMQQRTGQKADTVPSLYSFLNSIYILQNVKIAFETSLHFAFCS